MSDFWVRISDNIVTKLGGVSKLNAVYDYEIDKPENGKYPFATVSAVSFDGQFGDTIRNIRQYRYAIRVYQERTETGFGNLKTERVVREIADEILTAFDADTTLSGLVKMVRPVSGDFDYTDREIGDTRVAEFIIEAMAVVPSIT